MSARNIKKLLEEVKKSTCENKEERVADLNKAIELLNMEESNRALDSERKIYVERAAIKIDRLSEENNNLRQQLESIEAEQSNKDELLLAKDQDIYKLKKDFRRISVQMTDVKNRKRALEQEVQQLERSMDAKDSMLNELQHELDEKENNEAERRRQTRALVQELKDLKKKIKEMDDKLKELQEQKMLLAVKWESVQQLVTYDDQFYQDKIAATAAAVEEQEQEQGAVGGSDAD